MLVKYLSKLVRKDFKKCKCLNNYKCEIINAAKNGFTGITFDFEKEDKFKDRLQQYCLSVGLECQWKEFDNGKLKLLVTWGFN